MAVIALAVSLLTACGTDPLPPPPPPIPVAAWVADHKPFVPPGATEVVGEAGWGIRWAESDRARPARQPTQSSSDGIAWDDEPTAPHRLRALPQGRWAFEHGGRWHLSDARAGLIAVSESLRSQPLGITPDGRWVVAGERTVRLDPAPMEGSRADEQWLWDDEGAEPRQAAPPLAPPLPEAIAAHCPDTARAWSAPQGSPWVCRTADDSLRAFDAAGTELATWNPADGLVVHDVTLAAEGWVVVAGTHGELLGWHPASGRHWEPPWHPSGGRRVEVEAVGDGSVVVALGHGIALLDPATGARLDPTLGPRVRSLDWGPGPELVVTYSDQSELDQEGPVMPHWRPHKVARTDTFATAVIGESRVLDVPGVEHVRHVRSSPSGHYALVSTGYTWRLDTRTGHLDLVPTERNFVQGVDDEGVVWSLTGHELTAFDPTTNTARAHVRLPVTGHYLAVDEAGLWVAGQARRVRFDRPPLDAPAVDEPRPALPAARIELEGDDLSRITGLLVDPTGQLVVLGTRERIVAVDLVSAEQRTVAVLRSAAQLLPGTTDGSVAVAFDGRPLRVLPVQSSGVRVDAEVEAVDDDGVPTMAETASRAPRPAELEGTGALVLVDVDDAPCVVRSPTGAPTSSARSPDGRWLAWGPGPVVADLQACAIATSPPTRPRASQAQELRAGPFLMPQRSTLFDLANDQVIALPSGGWELLSRDGTVARRQRGGVELWSKGTGMRHLDKGTLGPVQQLAFTPSGQLVVVTGNVLHLRAVEAFPWAAGAVGR